MKTNILIAICILTVSLSISAQTMRKDGSPCESIKGKNYIGWSSGQFDKENPDAAGSSKLEFDTKGTGKSRNFLSYKPTDANGTHQILTIKCEVTTDKNNKKVSFLRFSVNGVEAGTTFITSYDNGSKVWAEGATPGRPMKGWMLLLPPNPPTADNLIKQT